MEFVARRDACNPRIRHLVPLPSRNGDGRFESQPPGLTVTERHWLGYMLSTLGFSGFSMRNVGFHQTTQSFGRYTVLRKVGLNHAQAIDRLLYE